VEEVITLLLANGSTPEAVLHLGDPETDALLLEAGVTLDRSHRTLLRTAIRAYNRDIRAQSGTLLGWTNGQTLYKKTISKIKERPSGTQRKSVGALAQDEKNQRNANAPTGSALTEFRETYTPSKIGDKEHERRKWHDEEHMKAQKLQMQAFLEMRDERNWWGRYNGDVRAGFSPHKDTPTSSRSPGDQVTSQQFGFNGTPVHTSAAASRTPGMSPMDIDKSDNQMIRKRTYSPASPVLASPMFVPEADPDED